MVTGAFGTVGLANQYAELKKAMEAEGEKNIAGYAKMGGSVSDAYAYQRYKESLIRDDAIENSRKIMNGKDLKDKDAIAALTADGSDISDWNKMESINSYKTEYGEGRVHFYLNEKTGQISTYDIKLKIAKPKDLITDQYTYWIIDMDENFIPIESRYGK